jgi:hypothetical protein
MTVPPETKHSLIGVLVALTTLLDGLRAEQDPGDLSIALRSALADRDLYNLYLASLVEDQERAKALLEVFDKVRLKYVPLCEGILNIPLRNRLLQPRNTTYGYSRSSVSFVVGRDCYLLPTSYPINSFRRLNTRFPLGLTAMFGKAYTTVIESRSKHSACTKRMTYGKSER